MILCIGDILVDMFGGEENGKMKFDGCCGGATFNLAVGAKKAGATVGFVGKVGKGVLGKYLIKQAEKAKFDYLDIQVDKERNTTVAFVVINDGERDFTFNRHETTDYNIEFNKVDFNKYKDVKILLLGSTMLAKPEGRKFAKKLFKKAKKMGVKVAFDVNFRQDFYKDFAQAVKAYEPYVKGVDIVKFSNDEIEMYTGISDIEKAVESICRKDQLFIVTEGGEGSFYYYNGKKGRVSTEKVVPIDTTGAGDAFFGTFLAELENKEWTAQNFEDALTIANKAGAQVTQFIGAVQLD